jgi:WD40 repeat protein/tetratricopeptide (TPR) repeat protein
VLEAISRRSPERRSREVEEAPSALVKQKLLATEEEGELRFEVDLLRRWIRERKPLREVEEELDRLKPEAEAAFQAGESLRRKKRWSMALRSYEEAVRIDPQHVSAHVALGECYLKTDLTRKAVEILEHAHRIDPRRARIELVNALLQYADEQDEENVALNLCDRVLELSPEEPRARRKKAEIWKARGDAHLLNRNRSRAHECYRRADHVEGIKKIERHWARRRRAVGGVAEELEGVSRRAWELANGCEGSRREAADRTLRGGWRRIARAFEAEARIFTELAAGFRAVGEEKWGLADQRYEAVEKELADEARRFPGEAVAPTAPAGAARGPTGEPDPAAETPPKRLGGVLTGLFDGARERVSGYLRGSGEQRVFDGLQRRPAAGGEGAGEPTEGDPEVRELLRSIVALRDEVQKIQGAGWSSVESLLDDSVSRRYLKKTREILRRRDATLSRYPPGIVALRRRDFSAVETVFGRIDEEKPPAATSPAGFAGGDARSAVAAVAPWASAVEEEDLEQTMTMRQNRVYRVAFSPERKWIASVSDAALALWLVEDGRQGELLEQRPQRVHDLAFSPAGETVAVASGAGMVTLWSVRTGEAMRVLEHEAPVGCLAFSSDGRLLATGTRDGSLHLWELPQGVALGRYRLEEPLASLVFSPRGGFLVVGTERGILHLWDVRKKKWGMQPWKQPGKPATPLVFSGDGKLLAWLAGTPEIRLWYVYDKKIRAFKGHQGVVRDLALSPDGDLLASVSEDRVARLWSTRNGVKLAEVSLPSAVVGVDFSPSMAEVVLVYSDKKISIWQLPEMDRPTGGG